MWCVVSLCGAFLDHSQSVHCGVNTSKMFFSESSNSDSDFDEDINFLVLASLLKKEKKKIKHWVHPVNRLRETRGAFHCLVRELESDEERFHRYFRLTKIQFEQVHTLIQNDIKKNIHAVSPTYRDKRKTCCVFEIFGDRKFISFSGVQLPHGSFYGEGNSSRSLRCNME